MGDESMTVFLRQMRGYPLLTAGEELELARRIERGDLDAKTRMINSNLRLVVSHARRYDNLSDLRLGDLVQEGVVGLIRAVEKFDWRRGYRFSTYATRWIQQAIQRSLIARGRTIRLPDSVAQLERRLSRAERGLAAELGREPTLGELAGEVGAPVAQIEQLHASTRGLVRLDEQLSEAGASRAELLPSDEEPLEEEVLGRVAREAVRRTVSTLPARQRSVIELRFGLAGTEPLPLAQVGRRLGISEGTASRIEREALAGLAREGELSRAA